MQSRTHSSHTSLSHRRYECFAPAGQLGIIIDTTSNGPMVHAIKPESRLQGLITPGDFVIGLDNIDTSQMAASDVTQLMASRSKQPQRKLTLQSQT